MNKKEESDQRYEKAINLDEKITKTRDNNGLSEFLVFRNRIDIFMEYAEELIGHVIAFRVEYDFPRIVIPIVGNRAFNQPSWIEEFDKLIVSMRKSYDNILKIAQDNNVMGALWEFQKENVKLGEFIKLFTEKIGNTDNIGGLIKGSCYHLYQISQEGSIYKRAGWYEREDQYIYVCETPESHEVPDLIDKEERFIDSEELGLGGKEMFINDINELSEAHILFNEKYERINHEVFEWRSF